MPPAAGSRHEEAHCYTGHEGKGSGGQESGPPAEGVADKGGEGGTERGAEAGGGEDNGDGLTRVAWSGDADDHGGEQGADHGIGGAAEETADVSDDDGRGERDDQVAGDEHDHHHDEGGPAGELDGQRCQRKNQEGVAEGVEGGHGADGDHADVQVGSDGVEEPRRAELDRHGQKPGEAEDQDRQPRKPVRPTLVMNERGLHRSSPRHRIHSGLCGRGRGCLFGLGGHRGWMTTVAAVGPSPCMIATAGLPGYLSS